MAQAVYESHEYHQADVRTRGDIISGLLVALEYLSLECRKNNLPEAAHLTGAAAEVCKEALETPNEAVACSQPD